MRTLKGSVDLLGLGNLLQILSMNGREGILTIARAEDRKSVHFGPEGIRLLFSSMRRINKLGKILLRRRRISKDDLDALLKEQRLLGWKLGQVALTSGLVRKEDVETALLELRLCDLEGRRNVHSRNENTLLGVVHVRETAERH